MSSWFYNKNLKPQGPFSLEEIRKKILKGEVAPDDLVLNEVEGQWKAAQSYREFERSLFPAFQVHYGVTFKSEKEWILLLWNAEEQQPRQEGPYSETEVLQKLKNGEVTPQTYIWKSGLSGWVKIQDRAEFSKSLTSPNP